ncbi:MAG TPA: AAA family ATPase, partial [Bacillota bacterium]|nr:AAA family ATPase [Bacillota bacterium]
SGGQKRRCEIAQALMHSPSVLFLDEPTTGLDPQTRAHVWESIRLLRQEQGTTVFLTTHYLEEAVHSSQIAIIDEGKIAAQGTPYELKERFSTDILKVASDDPAEVRNLLTAMALPYQEKEDVLHVKVPHSLKALEILKKIENHLLSFEVVHGTLEDVFLNITGKTLRED